MLAMLSYRFMRWAFLVGGLLSLVLPLSGTTLALHDMSLSGDALSHASLAGIAIALALGLSPLPFAALAAVIAGVVVEVIRKRFVKHQDLALAIVLSAALAIAGIAASYPSGQNLEKYLFGSLLMLSEGDIAFAIGLFAVTLAVHAVFGRMLTFTLFDEDAATVQGLPVRALDYLLAILASLSVALAAKIVGVLVVTSLMVLPVAGGMLVRRGYKNLLVIAIIHSFLSVMIGIMLAWWIPWAPGSLIVLVSFVFLGAEALCARVMKRRMAC